MEPNINIVIELTVSNYETIERAVKFLSKIQKEYSCNCTLSVKTITGGRF